MRRLYLATVFALGLIPAHLSAGTACNNFGHGNTVSGTSSVFFNTVGFAGTNFTTTGAGPLSTVLTNIDTPAPLMIGLYTNFGGTTRRAAGKLDGSGYKWRATHNPYVGSEPGIVFWYTVLVSYYRPAEHNLFLGAEQSGSEWRLWGRGQHQRT
jgi:hypothetical protein